MLRNHTYHRKKLIILFICLLLGFILLMIRLFYLTINLSEYYTQKADELHQREREIKAKRGRILDINGTVLADNETVCNISVIHNQIEDQEAVIELLSETLGLSQSYVTQQVEKVSSIEKIKNNVSKELGDIIREANLAGIKVDENYQRYYPYETLASKVLGFTGSDNQGIIGLEVIYEEVLQGQSGTILTTTDARGIEVYSAGEERIEPIDGSDLRISIDVNIQQYATQLAMQVLETKEAESVGLIVMNPNNGEIYAMVNAPEFNLNEPFTISDDYGEVTSEEEQTILNSIWRNGCINDTYEPGSIFKIITAAAALEEEVVTINDTFNCPGYIVVEDRKIHCHDTDGHGSETFTEAIMASCNPVFISVGLRLGIATYYDYFEKFQLLEKTGIDLPGEAGTIMHQEEDMGLVELATVSFGQSFQITPIQLITTVSSIINGGTRITPHFGIESITTEGEIDTFTYATTTGIVSEETSETMQYLLEQVVENGGGYNGYVEGFSIGGKTATSQTLPRGTNRYISSFLGFAPADDPQIIALVVITNPQGTYYGGQIAAPVIRQLYENILPYLEQKGYNK
ncbi:MAG: penicillin-binding transpeptidase domain-containing protein [Eubacteriales bacterium]